MEEWHFPRRKLAEQYLGYLDLGIHSSYAIVAPRRKGKTLFILNDLAPLSIKNDYIPVYATLWQNIDAPHEGLIAALEETIANFSKKNMISRVLQARINKTTVSNELLGKMEIEFADNPTASRPKELAYLDQLLSTLEKKAGKKTVLLLIDEIQHLATSPAFEPLTKALRSMLDKRQGRIKAIFTGSSRYYMNLLLNKDNTAFYNSVDTLPFPELDDEFLTFLKEKLAKEHSIKASVPSLRKAFTDIDKSPYWMMKLISYLITQKTTIKQAVAHLIELIEAAEDFPGIAKRMKPIDQIVFLALCEDENPFGQELMSKIDKETKVKGVQSNIQRSIKRLIDTSLVSQVKKGDYYIEKPGLKRYLLSIK